MVNRFIIWAFEPTFWRVAFWALFIWVLFAVVGAGHFGWAIAVTFMLIVVGKGWLSK